MLLMKQLLIQALTLTTFDPGRMIWNGYTSASGWVLREVFEVFEGIVGCNLIDNAVVMPKDLSEPRGDLKIEGVARDLRQCPF